MSTNLKTYLATAPGMADEQARAWWIERASQQARQTKRRVYVFLPAQGAWSLQFHAPGPRERQADVIVNKEGVIE